MSESEAAQASDADGFEERRQRLRLRFGAVAELYDRARPQYATDAMRWLLPAGTRRVLDLAAGTGKLTAVVLELGLDVIAIDPSEPMLAQLAARFPDVDARVGSAEHTGLADGAVDAVVIGSALHWFDRPAADQEIARVLRPGGVVGVLRNERDKSAPWVGELSRLLHENTPQRSHPGRPDRIPPFDPTLFEPAEVAEFPYSQILDADGLAELYASRSYVIELPAGEREALMEAIRNLARTHPDLAGQDEFVVPYRTEVCRYVRR